MLNEAIAGDFHTVTVAGADGLTAAAFLSSAGWSLAIASSSQKVTHVAIEFPTTAHLPTRMLMLQAANITSTNESSQSVNISQTALAEGLQNVAVPAYGLVVLLPAGKPE